MNVHVPESVLDDQNGDTTSMRVRADEEGLVKCHIKVRVKDGIIVKVSLKEPSTNGFLSQIATIDKKLSGR